MNDADYMARALSLAKRGSGWVNPNPLVGAVIVKDGSIIGEGWHTEFGHLHAEREALAACTEDPEGACVYVTLEPCCHTGKTPPCTDALIEAKVAKVVMGAPDPNPLVAGKGIQKLRDAGIEVVEGVMEDECIKVNRAFFQFVMTGIPYVTAKFAMTLDGKIATKTGASRWVTGEDARRFVHAERAYASAITVGVNTVIADDPELTCRISEQELGARPHNPARVVADTKLRTPLDSKLVLTANATPTIIATCVEDEDRLAPYEEAGCKMLILPERDGHVDLQALMKELGDCGMSSLILEGGAALNWSAFSSGIVSRVQAFIAPKAFGGKDAPGPIGGIGVDTPTQAFEFGDFDIIRLGSDLLLECEVK